MSARYIDYSGKVIDNRYRVIKLIAVGGMGSIYLGQHIVVGRKVAVKFLNRKFIKKSDIVMRFFREAQAAAAIRHKSIIDIWDTGISKQGDPYLVMEYLKGESLSDMLKRNGPIDLPAVCAVLEPVLSALSAAHEKGIIHRDLKPDNIFLAWMPGEKVPVIKIIDFGVSKLAATGQTKVTVAGTQFGTPAYMAPEQIRGEESLDHRADLYSVGVVLYKMLTGKLPFVGADNLAVFANALTKDPLPLKDAYKDAPTEASPVVLRLLCKDPKDRYPSAAALLEEIQSFPDYDERIEHLCRYTSGIAETTLAGGDIGASQSEGLDGESASHTDLSSLPRTTPTDWFKASKRPLNKRPGLLIGGAGVLFLVVGIVLWTSLRSFGDNTAITAATEVHATFSGPVNQLPFGGEADSASNAELTFFDHKQHNTTSSSVRMPDKTETLNITAEGSKDCEEDVTPHGDHTDDVPLRPLVTIDSKQENRSILTQDKKKKAPDRKDMKSKIPDDFEKVWKP